MVRSSYLQWLIYLSSLACMADMRLSPKEHAADGVLTSCWQQRMVQIIFWHASFAKKNRGVCVGDQFWLRRIHLQNNGRNRNLANTCTGHVQYFGQTRTKQSITSTCTSRVQNFGQIWTKQSVTSTCTSQVWNFSQNRTKQSLAGPSISRILCNRIWPIQTYLSTINIRPSWRTRMENLITLIFRLFGEQLCLLRDFY